MTSTSRSDRARRRPAAVLWDMDGTLVDTEPYWIECEFAMAAKYGGEWNDADALQMVGNNLVDSGRYMKKRWGVDLTPEEIVEELLDGVVEMVQSDVPWRPGARELLAALTGSGIRCGLVTMSYERFVAPILTQLPPETFRVVVTGDQVEFGKPHLADFEARRGLSPEPADRARPPRQRRADSERSKAL